MQQLFSGWDGRPDRQSGAVAIELAIVVIAGLIVAIIGTSALLGSSFFITVTGEKVINAGLIGSSSQLIVRTGVVAESGEIDVDGNDTILLSGVDELAIVKVRFVVEVSSDEVVDLSPPNTVDDTQTDPDSSGLTGSTFVNVSWDEFSTNTGQWTVLFLGDSNGDYFLENGERAEITLWLHQYDGVNVLYDLGTGTTDGFVDSASELLQARDAFTVEVIVDGSSSLVLNRSLPLELGTSDLLD